MHGRSDKRNRENGERLSPSLRTSPLDPCSGLTLIELIIVVAIVGILASAALPAARYQVKRQKERELRRDLWEMRDAIDKYKDAADRGGFQIKIDTLGYPPDLQTLVDGVDVQDKKVRFLRRIPVDPMTGTPDWGLRSNQDDPDSDSWWPERLRRPHQKLRHSPRRDKVQHMVNPSPMRSQFAALGSRLRTRRLPAPIDPSANPVPAPNPAARSTDRTPRATVSPGFTLLELLIVMVIIATLAAMAIPAYTRNVLAAKEAVLKKISASCAAASTPTPSTSRRPPPPSTTSSSPATSSRCPKTP